MKAIQFELWTECNVGCRYCYLGKRIGNHSIEDKMNGLIRAEKHLKEKNLDDYTIIAFIGGEFLQGQLNTPELKEKFFDILKLVKEYILQGKIEGAWLSASMTHTSNDFIQVLDMFKDIEPPVPQGGFWLITSYDNLFRFNKTTLETWKQNMKFRKENYPNIRVNTCSILTQGLVSEYLNTDCRFLDFMNEYDTQLYFKPPHIIGDYRTKQEQERKLPGFFPKRTDFLKFLAKVYDREEGYIYDKICNIKFRADELYRSGISAPEFREKNTRYEIISERFLKCGHPFPYAGYIDSDECMLCDKHRLSF